MRLLPIIVFLCSGFLYTNETDAQITKIVSGTQRGFVIERGRGVVRWGKGLNDNRRDVRLARIDERGETIRFATPYVASSFDNVVNTIPWETVLGLLSEESNGNLGSESKKLKQESAANHAQIQSNLETIRANNAKFKVFKEQLDQQ